MKKSGNGCPVLRVAWHHLLCWNWLRVCCSWCNHFQPVPLSYASGTWHLRCTIVVLLGTSLLISHTLHIALERDNPKKSCHWLGPAHIRICHHLRVVKICACNANSKPYNYVAVILTGTNFLTTRTGCKVNCTTLSRSSKWRSWQWPVAVLAMSLQEPLGLSPEEVWHNMQPYTGNHLHTPPAIKTQQSAV